MPDLSLHEFQRKDNQYIDADEFMSLMEQGYEIPENVTVVPVSLSQSPDMFNRIVRIKQAKPNTDINLISNVVKSKLSPNTVILNTAKLKKYFPSASGNRIISDINNGVPLSAETAKFLIDKNIIMDESSNYDVVEAWDDVLKFFGLSEKSTVSDDKILVPETSGGEDIPEVVDEVPEVVDEVPEVSEDDEKTLAKSAAPTKGKKKLKYRKTIAGKALQALARPVASAKAAKAPKTIVGKMLRPVKAAKAAAPPKTIVGKILRPLAAAKAADAPKTIAGKILRPLAAAKAADAPKTIAGKILRPLAARKAKKAAKKAKAAADKAVNSITMKVQKNEPVPEILLQKANDAAVKEERTAANAEILANAAPDELVTITNVKTGEPIQMMSIE